MDLQLVRDAVRTLRARNERVSVRSVHALIGGSSRDLSRLLRDATEFLAEDEVAALETEGSEPLSPAPGQIAQAYAAVQAAEEAVGEVQTLLDARADELRRVRSERPPAATDPDRVAEVVQDQIHHELRVAELEREVQAFQRILDARRAEQQALRADFQRLRARAHQLKASQVPSLQRQLGEARQALAARERDAAHQVRLARQQLEATERALAAVERELAALVG